MWRRASPDAEQDQSCETRGGWRVGSEERTPPYPEQTEEQRHDQQRDEDRQRDMRQSARWCVHSCRSGGGRSLLTAIVRCRAWPGAWCRATRATRNAAARQRARELREAGRWLEVDPAVLIEVDLRPGMRLCPMHNKRVRLVVVGACGVAADDARRHAQ